MSISTDYTKEIEKISKQIVKEPENAGLYLKRALIYDSLNNFNKAIEDSTTAIQKDPKQPIYYSTRAVFYENIDDKDSALKDYFKRLEIDPKDEDTIKSVGEIYFKQKNYEKSYEYFRKIIDNPYTEIEDEIAEDIAQIGEYFFSIKEYDRAMEIFSQLPDLNIQIASGYDSWGAMANIYKEKQTKLNKDIERKILKIDIENKNKIARAKIEERNKTIADLSHSIKSMISSVIDPLENLKKEKDVKPIIIDNALRGSNLIREIVNAMSLSFKGSFDDFIYDAKHNSEKESLNINSMFIESLKHSVINMFDGKYFYDFTHKYFPLKNSFLKAKEDWKKISQLHDKQKIEKFLKNHFFDINFDFDKSVKYTIGSEKGSAIKLMILLQEIIFNAVKYSSFVKKDERFLKIKFSASKEKITIKVENKYKPKVKTKTTGLGHVIIENFAKLLNTKPVIKKSNDIYSISITFKNFWGK